MTINLGDEVKDTVTGFKGIATGRSTYLTGCNHICLQPKVGKDGKFPESRWFDEPMLEVVKKGKVKAKPTLKGGPMLMKPSR